MPSYTNDLGVSDEQALRIIREKIATARTDIEHAETILREYEAERKTSLKPGVKVLLKQRKISLLRRQLVKLKTALALGERAERELLNRISSSHPEVTAEA